MRKFIILTRSEAKRFLRRCWESGVYPRRGFHVGAGRHTPIAETWDGRGAPPGGWTKFLHPWHPHPNNTGAGSDQFALKIDDLARDLWRRIKSEFTAAERSALQSRIDTAADLAAEWKPDGNLTRGDLDRE